jgi:hypothetical protein
MTVIDEGQRFISYVIMAFTCGPIVLAGLGLAYVYLSRRAHGRRLERILR